MSSEFKVPSENFCRANVERLKSNWLKSSHNCFDQNKVDEAKRFFEKCLVFYHLPFDNIEDLFKILSSGVIKSNRMLRTEGITVGYKRTKKLDIFLGLDRYVFLSFGVPILPTGPLAILLAFPFLSLLNNFKYPDTWASWNDIMIYAENIFGYPIPEDEIIRKDDFKNQLSAEYCRHIFLLEDLPTIAASFAVSFYTNYAEALINRWKTGLNQYYARGPEIKIATVLPLKYASYCFISRKDPSIMKGIEQSSILPPECVLVEDRYFTHIQEKVCFIKEFYGVSL